MGELTDVDLGRELPSHRGLERLAGAEVAAGKRPRAVERLACTLPEERVEPVLAHLQHDGEHGLAGGCGRIADKFLPHRRKP
jgi:hypothetical protein